MRFYLPTINKSHLELIGDAHIHAAYALRIHVGDDITVFDGRGHDYLCKVKEIKKDKTLLELLKTDENVGETKISITLYMAVIKQDKFELTVQKATELGVTKIVPVYSKLAQRNISLNYDRLNKIAISACEQCGRSRLPIIDKTLDFDEFINQIKDAYVIFPWERENNGNIQSVIDKSKTDVSIFVGPEGGITLDEKNMLTAVGAKSVTLGARILRAETAAIATLSVVYYELGEWNL